MNHEQREEFKRLLADYERSEPSTIEFRHASVDLAAFVHEIADTLLADQNTIAAPLLAKMRSKQFACEQANLGPEAAWWREAQRLLGEVTDAEAALAEVRKEAVREFAEALTFGVGNSDGIDANATIVMLRLINRIAANRGVELNIDEHD